MEMIKNEKALLGFCVIYKFAENANWDMAHLVQGFLGLMCVIW